MKYDIFVKELDKLADNDTYETYQDCLNALSADAKAEWEELAYSACGYYGQDNTSVVDYDNGMFYYADDDNSKMKELTDVEEYLGPEFTEKIRQTISDKGVTKKIQTEKKLKVHENNSKIVLELFISVCEDITEYSEITP